MAWPGFWQQAQPLLSPLFNARFSASGLHLDEATLQNQLQTLYTRLLETNQHTNLTRITDAEGFLTRHILDSWSLVPYLPNPQSQTTLSILDIGSGAGFPVLPLALVYATARPTIHFHAVDSVAKKVGFIQQAAGELDLSNLTAHHTRVEDFAHQEAYREQMACVTARAVAAMPTLLELALPCLQVGGQLLAQKSVSGWAAETKDAQTALKLLHAKISATHPGLTGDTVIGVVEKRKATPKRYPRGQNQPRKTPLV